VISIVDDPGRGERDEFLAACGIRFAPKNARFSNFEGTIGLPPGSGGVAWMTLHIGRARASFQEIVLISRQLSSMVMS
jgi:enoyl-CoA hydratase/carnithine racemase